MARTGITYLEVADAIAHLQGQQKNITVDNVREHLGTGSKTTIAKFIREWKSKNGIHNTDESAIPNDLLQLVRGLWEKIQSDANQKIDAHQLRANETIQEAQDALAQIQQNNALLQHKIELLEQKLNDETQSNESLKNVINQLGIEKTKSLERLSMLEIQNNHHQSENDRLHQHLKNTQDNLVHYQQSVEKQRFLQQMQIEKERADYTLKLTILEKQFSKMSEEKSVVETKYQLLIDEYKIQKNNLEGLEKENSQFKLKNNELMIENNHLNVIKEKLQNEFTSVTQSLKENEKVCHELTIEVAILKNENGALNKKSASDENKIRLIQNDLNQLSQENASLKRTIKEATV